MAICVNDRDRSCVVLLCICWTLLPTTWPQNEAWSRPTWYWSTLHRTTLSTAWGHTLHQIPISPVILMSRAQCVGLLTLLTVIDVNGGSRKTSNGSATNCYWLFPARGPVFCHRPVVKLSSQFLTLSSQLLTLLWLFLTLSSQFLTSSQIFIIVIWPC